MISSKATFLTARLCCGHCGTIGLLLRGEDGAKHEIRMTPDEVRKLIARLSAVVDSPMPVSPDAACPHCWRQRSSSSGNPHSAGSPQEGQNV